MSTHQVREKDIQGTSVNGGRFAASRHAESSITLGGPARPASAHMGGMEKLTASTPVDIDTELAELYYRQAKHASRIGSLRASMDRDAVWGRGRSAGLAEALANEEATLRAVEEEIAPFDAEFRRRGGWSRFFMVMANDGHLHKSRSCHSCTPKTVYAWMPEFSGEDEAGVVEMAGKDACTFCFPTAPVHQPSMLPFRVAEREEAQQRAAEREAKRAAALAGQVVVGDKVFKTVRGAENEVGWQIECAVGSSLVEPVNEDHRAQLARNVAQDVAKARSIAESIAQTVPGYDIDGLLAKKLAAKVKMYRKYGRDVPADYSLEGL
ncbi:hypothetical protein [Arthrobacter sp. A2-55]|uniref:hypothetical protein n=1 Tax=Arthrobacter sp. A2-55 TaxID=2897337 RepID=UPI0021CDD053|nr:hypothetical protein [Arthrobacter sp. A2-55]MCU6479006.1 hypothetical protein [Arthrobacter sp. A2-55]